MGNKKITVQLSCTSCKGTDFDIKEDETYVRCNTCNREYHGGYDELVRHNQAKINRAVDQTKKAIINDFDKSLKDIFRGNKYIKFK